MWFPPSETRPRRPGSSLTRRFDVTPGSNRPSGSAVTHRRQVLGSAPVSRLAGQIRRKCCVPWCSSPAGHGARSMLVGDVRMIWVEGLGDLGGRSAPFGQAPQDHHGQHPSFGGNNCRCSTLGRLDVPEALTGGGQDGRRHLGGPGLRGGLGFRGGHRARHVIVGVVAADPMGASAGAGEGPVTTGRPGVGHGRATVGPGACGAAQGTNIHCPAAPWPVALPARRPGSSITSPRTSTFVPERSTTERASCAI